VTRREKSQIELVAPPAASVEDAMREAMFVLAKLTGYPAVASLPTASRDTLRMLQLNAVPPRRLVLVLVTTAGRIEHRLFEIGEEIAPTTLQVVVNWLNETLGGLSLAGARDLSFEAVSKGLHDAPTIELARRAWEIVRDSVSDIADEKIVVQGLITLLDEPEFSDIGHARAALRVLEDETALGGVLRDVPENSEWVRIGRELPPLDLKGEGGQFFSFVGVSYGVAGQSWGALGVLGPSRMRYGDALSLVPALARRLQATLETL
jgi:heat-inducible transcriptional repressor